MPGMGEDLPVLFETLSAESFLEYAFLRWVLTPALAPSARPYVVAQEPIVAGQHTYRVDYALHGTLTRIAIELDGFAYHGSRDAFTHDRLRQNDLQALGWRMLRFSYDAIRTDTARCIAQIQAMCRVDPGLAPHVIARPVIAIPEMSPDPLSALRPAPRMVSYGAISMTMSYPAVVSPAASQQAVSPNYAPAQLPHSFERLRGRLDLRPLRRCQLEAFAALANYYRAGGRHAACVMSVGAGKTALGVAAALAFTRQRALVVTPGNVVRGAFDRALDPQAVGNALYGLPGGPLIPGSAPPRVLTLDRSDGAISHVERQSLLDADILVTNFQSLGTGAAPDDVLAKLHPDDVDLLVVDEAHIAAADSYQRLFRHFADARTLLMSACFQRLDGRPIDADVVYRYRLIDSIADGNAKTLRIQRFTPVSHDTTYYILLINNLCQ